ncbi:MAG: PQQ-binding-like beta-propeller repeat protein [Chloracidobacterium sp.]|nr:PQQ-binding-like beta-propeller repeat protein [Chloracidobacterium sp.]
MKKSKQSSHHNSISALAIAICKLSLLTSALFSVTVWSATLGAPEWSYDPGEGVLQPQAFPNAEHADGILLTGSSGKVVLVGSGGKALAEMRLDLQASAEAIPIVFHQGEEPRIIAADVSGSVYCFRRDGKRLWKYSRDGKATDFRRLLAVGGPGRSEIVFSDSRGHLYLVDSAGRLRFELTTTAFRISAAAASQDKAGRRELIFGTEDRDLWAVRRDGTVVWRAPVSGPIGRSLPIVANLGDAHAVLVSTPFVGAFQGIFALDADTGARLWTAPSLLQSYHSIAVADIDGDGATDVLYGDKSTHITCVNAKGQMQWSAHLDGRGVFFAPAVADLEGKGHATIFQVVRAAGVNGKSLYELDAQGKVLEAMELPGGGASAPLVCRWRNESDLRLVVAGGSGRTTAYRLAQSAGAKILWSGLRGAIQDKVAAASPESEPATASGQPVDISLGTTELSEEAAGASAVAFRVVDPNGVAHLTLCKPEPGKPPAAALFADQPGDYRVTTWRYTSGPTPVETKQKIYRASISLSLASIGHKDELSEYLNAKDNAAWKLAMTTGKAENYDAAKGAAQYSRMLLAAIDRVKPAGPLMAQVVRNPWAQHTAMSMLDPGAVSGTPIRVRMLGNEYESAAIALTNVTAHPVTVVLRSSIPAVVEFRTAPLVVSDTTGIPQEDPLPLMGEDQMVALGPAETREIWLTLHSRNLAAGKRRLSLRAAALERMEPPMEIPVDLEVSHVRLPERFTYRHCNWLYLASITDERVLDATIRDATEHGTNVFNIPPASVTLECGGAVVSGDNGVSDRLIRRLPGAFFMVDGSVGLKWPAGCKPDAATEARGWENAIRWYARRMLDLGLGYADYALYLQDEPGLSGKDEAFDRYVESVRRVKAADPQMQVYTNPAGGATPEMLEPLAGLVDVWCPDLHLFRLHPAEYMRIFKQAKAVWHYEAPSDQRRLDPLGFYRMKPWIAFQLGMQGGGYWVYSSTDYFTPDPSRGTEYGVVCPTPRGPVTTKRWEASRDGAEDFELLTMLRKAAMSANTIDGKAALALVDEAVAFVTRGQEEASDINRQLRAYAPDYTTWMEYRDRLIDAAEKLIR